MVGNKIFLLYFSVIAFQVMESVADIHEARSSALRKVDAVALETLNLGKETEKQVIARENIVTNVNSQINRQGKNIATHAITEVQDEVQISFTKANMLYSNQTVFTCLFNAGESGEISIEERYSTFQNTVAVETQKTKTALNNKTDQWSKDMTVQEEEYRTLYKNSTAKIYEAEKETDIETIVEQFKNKTSSFQTAISKILIDIATFHSTYFNNLQTQITTLRTNTVSDENATFSEIKACFSRYINFYSLLDVDFENFRENLNNDLFF